MGSIGLGYGFIWVYFLVAFKIYSLMRWMENDNSDIIKPIITIPSKSKESVFLKEDHPLMTPKQVLGFEPVGKSRVRNMPKIITYQ